MNIEEMKDWDILVYLRENRNWMVQSHYDRDDIERLFDIKFNSDEDWLDFTVFACDSFDNCKEVIMSTIVSCYEDYKQIN